MQDWTLTYAKGLSISNKANKDKALKIKREKEREKT